MKVKVGLIEYDAAKAARVVGAVHCIEKIGGEPFCAVCKTVWPCPEVICSKYIMERVVNAENEKGQSV